MAIPRYRPHAGPIILSAGFRPFFLAASVWAAVGIPLWLGFYAADADVPTLLVPAVWHVHEMVFGFAAATVAGFLLTAVPNWTGRMPLQGTPLAVLIGLWAIGRAGVFFSEAIGAPIAAAADLCFPIAFLFVIAREIVAGKNWRNLPVLVALSLLLAGNLLVHVEALDIADTAELGNRLGLATLFMLIALIGGRVAPAFTRNWLAKMRPDVPPPVPNGRFDTVALVVSGLALVAWVAAPDATATSAAVLIAGIALGARLSRWRGLMTMREPLLLILHVGYGWLAVGLLLLGANGLAQVLPQTDALHALTVGAVGTMTLAMMTRASLGHLGRPLAAGPGTIAMYVLITAAAVLRILASTVDDQQVLVLSLAGAAWSSAFGLFAVLYGKALTSPRALTGARPI